MIDIVEEITDRLQGKAPKGAKRSPEWREVRGLFIIENPTCFICESTSKLTVHHLIPFHLAPDLELDPDNFMTLCQNKKYGINCHLLVGHLGNFRKINVNCIEDARIWHEKIKG